MASRSEQVLLSCPSSLQGHSDFPSTPNACLAGFIQLGLRLPPSDLSRSRGISGPISVSLSSHAVDLTPGPPPVHLPFFFPVGIGLPLKRTGSASSSALANYPSFGLSQLYAPDLISRGCIIRFVLRPASLVGTPDWVRGTCRGKFRPGVTTRTRPLPTYL